MSDRVDFGEIEREQTRTVRMKEEEFDKAVATMEERGWLVDSVTHYEQVTVRLPVHWFVVVFYRKF